jgi:hypothetical protein
MNRSVLNLSKVLFDNGILLVESEDGDFHLFHLRSREKIGEFIPDFHSLVVGVETSIQDKSDALLKWLNTYWEERFQMLTEAAN